LYAREGDEVRTRKTVAQRNEVVKKYGALKKLKQNMKKLAAYLSTS
jgi:hypothetical protein